ncbi:hypothetical protein KCU61_g5705, partial [Aureobasidium melanogenum]
MASLSFSLGGSSSKPTQRRSSPPPTKTTNGTKRHHAALLDDASDDEDANHSKRQTITHFDSAAGGAVDARAPKKEEKKPLVITALANRDWREASKRQRAQKYGITTEQLDARTQAAQNGDGADKVVKETEAVKYGLNVFAPSASASAEDTQQEEESEQLQEEKPEQQKTADQLAIDALTGAAPTSTLTIPTAAVTEEDAFNDSYHSAPPAPSLSDYAAVPVEEYGAAMLRGMGWKGPSSTSQSKPTKKGQLPPAKRPALLGIGADPNAAAQAEELGAWGKSSSRGRKEPTMFIPVSMKNKKTGETLTEEELRDKIRRDKEEAENQRFIVNDLEIRNKERERRDEESRTERKRRDDYSDDEEEKRRRRKDRERDYDRHDHRSRDYDRKDRRERDRSRDRDSKRDRSRDRSDYYDKKSSSRRDRSRDRDYERRDRDYEKSSSRRDHRYEDSTSKSSSRRDRSRDRYYHRSSRR